MGLFSFLKQGKQLRCDWCRKEIETPKYTKQAGSKIYHFCSESCKKIFRKSGKGSSCGSCCPTCPLSR